MAVDNKYLDDTIKTIRSRKNVVKGMKQFNAGTFEKLAILHNELNNFQNEISIMVRQYRDREKELKSNV